MTDYSNIQWKDFSINSNEFAEAVLTENLNRLLYAYFTSNCIPNSGFLSELADHYPNEFIRAIRNSQAFFNDEHYSSLHFLRHHPNTYLSSHSKVFSKLAELEKEHYFSFLDSLKSTTEIDVLEVMVVVSLWFEKIRADLFSNGAAAALQYDLIPQIEEINFFLTHFLFENKNRVTNLAISEFDDIKAFIKVATKYNSQAILSKHPVWQCLEKTHIYMYYLSGTFEVYSFDMNYEVHLNNGVVETKFIDQGIWNKWYRDECKIAHWYSDYRMVATEMVSEKLFENPNFIKDTTGFDFDMNFEGAIRRANAFLIAEDYCLDESLLHGVPNSSLIDFLTGFVSNAYGRYVLPMDDANARNPENWLKNTLGVCMEFAKNEISAIPLRLVSKSDFKSLAALNLKNSEKNLDSLIKLISYDISKTAYINRLNPVINLVGKPFLKMGECYLAFNGILGESNSQVNSLINIMDSNFKAHQKVEKQEIDRFEQRLESMFKNSGYKNAVCSKKYKTESIEGDLDLQVYENGVYLLIEFKRSKIRTTLSDVYNEYENSLVKASKQLDKAMNFIENHFTYFKDNQGKSLEILESNPKQIKIYSIIVSTSIEYDHELIRGKHLKISLYELQRILEVGTESISDNKIESLMQTIFSNRFWEPVIENAYIPDINNWTLRFE